MPLNDDDYQALLPEERALIEELSQIKELLGQTVQMLGQVTQALMAQAQAASMPRRRRIVRGQGGKAEYAVEEPIQ